jgi:hypothetical protein
MRSKGCAPVRIVRGAIDPACQNTSTSEGVPPWRPEDLSLRFSNGLSV